MKKFLLLFSMTLMFVLNSCSRDEGVSETTLVGTWYLLGNC